jgi:hypothetical protein
MVHEEFLTEKRAEILGIAAKYGAHNVRVFGSPARGEADEQSDVDFLVEMEPGRSLLELGGLQVELEALLGCPVDVVTEKDWKARIRGRVLAEVVAVKETRQTARGTKSTLDCYGNIRGRRFQCPPRITQQGTLDILSSRKSGYRHPTRS